MKREEAVQATHEDVRVQYFPATPDVTREIEEWARKKGVRILSLVPVYWEDVPRGATQA